MFVETKQELNLAKILLKEYAVKSGVTSRTVYNWIWGNKIKAEKEGNNIYIIVDERKKQPKRYGRGK